MLWVYLLLAACAGVATAVQAGVNAELRRVSGQPLFAGLVSFSIGAGTIAVFFLLSRAAWPARERLAAGPPWIWIGGLLGAFVVLTAIVAAPRLGSGALVAATVAGQLVGAVIIDQFGWVGFAPHALSLWRIIGVILIVAGVFLVQRF